MRDSAPALKLLKNLLRLGADPARTNGQGRTAFDLAVDHPSICNLLGEKENARLDFRDYLSFS
jgi:hypothetical protein